MNRVLVRLNSPTPDAGRFIVRVDYFHNPVQLAVLGLTLDDLSRNEPT